MNALRGLDAHSAWVGRFDEARRLVAQGREMQKELGLMIDYWPMATMTPPNRTGPRGRGAEDARGARRAPLIRQSDDQPSGPTRPNGRPKWEKATRRRCLRASSIQCARVVHATSGSSS
jgi:hypothetical protein